METSTSTGVHRAMQVVLSCSPLILTTVIYLILPNEVPSGLLFLWGDVTYCMLHIYLQQTQILKLTYTSRVGDESLFLSGYLC